MELKLYNTLTRKKAPFVPIDANNVRMYACGPTVYDFAHIGNARPVIVFDVLYRLLRHIYGVGHVKYVRNITDVDDKINARAAEEYPDLELNAAVAEVTAKTTKQFHEDIAALGVLPPDVEPTCTSHIPQMVEMIKVLIAKGNAYEAEGHVLLDTASVPDYGSLSGRSLDEMIAGARVEVAPYKRNPSDSVMWKPSDDSLPGWPSPWGRGRPGWHIECSAMAKEHLGEVFDIHGGGIDLTFPHHENELAQSRCAHDTDVMANVWMHNGFLQVEGDKMSKSLGNFVTINELLADWPGEVLRYNMLRSHYRQPIDWTVKGLEESAKTLAGFYGGEDFSKAEKSFAPPVLEALSDDMNTPAVMTALHQLAHSDDRPALVSSLRALGFAGDLTDPRASGVDEAAIQQRIDQRLAARAAKDFAEADRIRDELAAQGIALKDGPEGTTWELVR
ncbi:MAG: cysteine--tRNA ligase [Alphaproteobacteria bacterium]|nr:cysteine--tRNA ligase [Alphaproteobacteria bacterium]